MLLNEMLSHEYAAVQFFIDNMNNIIREIEADFVAL
jgi:hypothetical protein